MAKEKKATREDEKEFSKIYIGPTFPKYNLQENSVFINKFPANIDEAIEKYPTIKSLMLDIKNIKDRYEEKYKSLYKSLKEEIGGK